MNNKGYVVFSIVSCCSVFSTLDKTEAEKYISEHENKEIFSEPEFIIKCYNTDTGERIYE